MTLITKDRKSHVQKSEFDENRFRKFINEIVTDSDREYDKNTIENLKTKLIEEITTRHKIEADKLFDLIIREVNDLISPKTPEYTYLSASALRRKLYKKVSKERGFDYKKGYGDYLPFVRMMTEKGLYSDDILNSYSEEEIAEAGSYIDKAKDKLFSYAGLHLLKEIHLKKDYDGTPLELMQERFLSIAMYLMKDEEKSQRMSLVKEAYWAQSNHYIGNSTPTMMNSASPNGTLSSCHIVTFSDDLDGIMNGLSQVAKFSQNGAGLGERAA